MQKNILVLVFVVFLSGCRTFTKMPELLNLKRFAKEQDEIVEHVQSEDEHFDLLLKAVEDGSIDEYKKAKNFVSMFGDPILKKEVIYEGQKVQKWLYRYQTKYFDSPKVYVYFDKDFQLVAWEYFKGK